MKHQVYFGIAIRIVVLCVIGMMCTYITPQLRTFFDDKPCDQGFYLLEPDWCWGARHHWYFWMMLSLFILSLINVIVAIENLVKKHYPPKK